MFPREHHAGFGLIFKTEQYQNSLKQYLYVYEEVLFDQTFLLIDLLIVTRSSFMGINLTESWCVVLSKPGCALSVDNLKGFCFICLLAKQTPRASELVTRGLSDMFHFPVAASSGSCCLASADHAPRPLLSGTSPGLGHVTSRAISAVPLGFIFMDMTPGHRGCLLNLRFPRKALPATRTRIRDAVFESWYMESGVRAWGKGDTEEETPQ